MMRVFIACCTLSVFLGACADSSTSQPSRSESGELVVASADPNVGIDATYREQGRMVHIVIRPSATGAEAAVTDDAGRSVVARAAAVANRPRWLRTATGERLVEVSQLFDDANDLAETGALLRRTFRALRLAVPDKVFRSPLFDALRAQKHGVDRALALTRVALLLEWRDEARRNLSLSTDEQAKLNAIFADRARLLWRKDKQVTTTAPDHEIETLVGPERYAQYVALHQKWFAPAAVGVMEVMP